MECFIKIAKRELSTVSSGLQDGEPRTYKHNSLSGNPHSVRGETTSRIPPYQLSLRSGGSCHQHGLGLEAERRLSEKGKQNFQGSKDLSQLTSVVVTWIEKRNFGSHYAKCCKDARRQIVVTVPKNCSYTMHSA
ncbi:unnamed protein product [Protopolystoma xenopodis]|uniref:Uncharacterized protein n=1 Tax=Protopolystoma xenopodis TaxID=117903 RepID=A0A3S5AQA3_9PLAT|nr:unnamed protein product [Protopolystoma xenopodis]